MIETDRGWKGLALGEGAAGGTDGITRDTGEGVAAGLVGIGDGGAHPTTSTNAAAIHALDMAPRIRRRPRRGAWSDLIWQSAEACVLFIKLRRQPGRKTRSHEATPTPNQSGECAFNWNPLKVRQAKCGLEQVGLTGEERGGRVPQAPQGGANTTKLHSVKLPGRFDRHEGLE